MTTTVAAVQDNYSSRCSAEHTAAAAPAHVLTAVGAAVQSAGIVGHAGGAFAADALTVSVAVGQLIGPTAAAVAEPGVPVQKRQEGPVV